MAKRIRKKSKRQREGSAKPAGFANRIRAEGRKALFVAGKELRIPSGLPKTYPECVRPDGRCGRVSCKHHLYLDATGSGLKINHPDIEPQAMPEPCVLEIARKREGCTLEEAGDLLNVTRERVRQIESTGLYKLKVAKGVIEPERSSVRKARLGIPRKEPSYQKAVRITKMKREGVSHETLRRVEGAQAITLMNLLDRLHPVLIEGWKDQKRGYVPANFFELVSNGKTHDEQMALWKTTKPEGMLERKSRHDKNRKT